jgi:hypothetical protein
MHMDSLGAVLDRITHRHGPGGDQLVETTRCPATATTINSVSRRMLLLGPIIAALPVAFWTPRAQASKLDPSQTIITLPPLLSGTAWTGLPPHIGEMATLYGGLDKPGPYVVYMKWYPGYMSAPHQYATDRLSVVLSGTWWVNSGGDFEPNNAVPVPAGGFVRRVAHTLHYDGVKKGAGEPAVIAIFGTGPVDLKLADPSKPSWRKV